MQVDINTAAKISKGLSIKREKGPGDTEVVVAHLKLGAAWIPRETVDALVGRYEGWCNDTFFDELGAPITRLSLKLRKVRLTATGVIRGTLEADRVTLTDATLDDIEIDLADKGANLSGSLSWKTAGDESSDLEPLLGRVCIFHAIVQDGGQQDLLQSAA